MKLCLSLLILSLLLNTSCQQTHQKYDLTDFFAEIDRVAEPIKPLPEPLLITLTLSDPEMTVLDVVHKIYAAIKKVEPGARLEMDAEFAAKLKKMKTPYVGHIENKPLETVLDLFGVEAERVLRYWKGEFYCGEEFREKDIIEEVYDNSTLVFRNEIFKSHLFGIPTLDDTYDKDITGDWNEDISAPSYLPEDLSDMIHEIPLPLGFTWDGEVFSVLTNDQGDHVVRALPETHRMVQRLFEKCHRGFSRNIVSVIEIEIDEQNLLGALNKNAILAKYDWVDLLKSDVVKTLNIRTKTTEGAQYLFFPFENQKTYIESLDWVENEGHHKLIPVEGKIFMGKGMVALVYSKVDGGNYVIFQQEEKKNFELISDRTFELEKDVLDENQTELDLVQFDTASNFSGVMLKNKEALFIPGKKIGNNRYRATLLLVRRDPSFIPFKRDYYKSVPVLPISKLELGKKHLSDPIIFSEYLKNENLSILVSPAILNKRRKELLLRYEEKQVLSIRDDIYVLTDTSKTSPFPEYRISKKNLLLKRSFVLMRYDVKHLVAHHPGAILNSYYGITSYVEGPGFGWNFLKEGVIEAIQKIYLGEDKMWDGETFGVSFDDMVELRVLAPRAIQKKVKRVLVNMEKMRVPIIYEIWTGELSKSLGFIGEKRIEKNKVPGFRKELLSLNCIPSILSSIDKQIVYFEKGKQKNMIQNREAARSKKSITLLPVSKWVLDGKNILIFSNLGKSGHSIILDFSFEIAREHTIKYNSLRKGGQNKLDTLNASYWLWKRKVTLKSGEMLVRSFRHGKKHYLMAIRAVIQGKKVTNIYEGVQ